MFTTHSPSELGWRHFFQQQLSVQEWETLSIARVIGVERSEVYVQTPGDKLAIPILSSMPPLAVGDWILLEADGRFHRLLQRYSLFSRKAAGTKAELQLIAANIDTLFIVTSMNLDFNLNRIERYLVLANEAGVDPVIVLTKADLCESPDEYLEKIHSINPMLEVVAVNSLDTQSVSSLYDWCTSGKTVAFLGSSGVGKSTLINSLSGKTSQRTDAIREDDDKGRHTTTSRSLHLLPSGGLLLDTPGMRELQIVDTEQGIAETFPEIEALASKCKFSDCRHESEPGCAVMNAILSGELDERRLNSYRKLLREQAANKATLAEKRARDRDFGRHVRSVQKSHRKYKPTDS